MLADALVLIIPIIAIVFLINNEIKIRKLRRTIKNMDRFLGNDN